MPSFWHDVCSPSIPTNLLRAWSLGVVVAMALLQAHLLLARDGFLKGQLGPRFDLATARKIHPTGSRNGGRPMDTPNQMDGLFHGKSHENIKNKWFGGTPISGKSTTCQAMTAKSILAWPDKHHQVGPTVVFRHPSDKYGSQLGLLFPRYEKNSKCSKPATSFWDQISPEFPSWAKKSPWHCAFPEVGSEGTQICDQTAAHNDVASMPGTSWGRSLRNVRCPTCWLVVWIPLKNIDWDDYSQHMGK